MIRINSFSVFIKWLFYVLFIFYFSFQIFNYFYPWNYCDYFSNVVKLNSKEDIQLTKKCINTLVCEIGDTRLSLMDTNNKTKAFTCVRKYKSWVWNW